MASGNRALFAVFGVQEEELQSWQEHQQRVAVMVDIVEETWREQRCLCPITRVHQAEQEHRTPAQEQDTAGLLCP